MFRDMFVVEVRNERQASMTYRIRVAIAAAIAGAGMPVTPAAAEPETYILDNAHTHVMWAVERFGFTKTLATFADVTGEVILDEDQPAQSSVYATIRVASLRSDLEKRENIIRSKFWLDAEQFPKISFISTTVTVLDDVDGVKSAEVIGDLSVHGETLPVSMTVTLNKIGTDPVTKRKAAGFSAKGALSRKAFGVTTAAALIGDKVGFAIEALAVQPE